MASQLAFGDYTRAIYGVYAQTGTLHRPTDVHIQMVPSMLWHPPRSTRRHQNLIPAAADVSKNVLSVRA